MSSADRRHSSTCSAPTWPRDGSAAAPLRSGVADSEANEPGGGPAYGSRPTWPPVRIGSTGRRGPSQSEVTSSLDESLWVRATLGVQQVDGRWLIVHDHESVPFDAATGQALTGLQP